MANSALRTSVDSVRKWHSLAERRRNYFVELYRSDRWRRYFTEEAFAAHMREVIHNVEVWEKVLHETGGSPVLVTQG